MRMCVLVILQRLVPVVRGRRIVDARVDLVVERGGELAALEAVADGVRPLQTLVAFGGRNGQHLDVEVGRIVVERSGKALTG